MFCLIRINPFSRWRQHITSRTDKIYRYLYHSYERKGSSSIPLEILYFINILDFVDYRKKHYGLQK